MPAFYDDALEESVRANELYMEYRGQKTQEKSQKFIENVIWVFGALVSLAALLALTDKPLEATPHELLLKAAKTLIEWPFVSIVGTFSVAYFLRMFRSGLFRSEENSFFIFVRSILQPLSKNASGSILILLSVIIITVPFIIWLNIASHQGGDASDSWFSSILHWASQLF